MLQVEEALSLILQHAPTARTGRVALEQALGLFLAKDIDAPESLPPFARSGMDGYAVRSVDTREATRENPVLLQLQGTIPAGHPLSEAIRPGCCAAIMTGGAVPEGADAVIRQEEVRVTEGAARIFRPVPCGENVAPVGEDVALGDRLLQSGQKIRPAEVGLLAAVGISEVEVCLPPRVGILCTGDELALPGRPLGPAQIHNSNGPGLSAMVRAAGGIPVYLGQVPDVTSQITEALRRAPDCDLILTSGGVSVGEFDVVRAAHAALGAEELFWRVALKPGTPVCAAIHQGKLMIGLSGNPSAGMLNFDLLVRPLLDQLCGRPRLGLRQAEGILDQPVQRVHPLGRYLRSRLYLASDGHIHIDTGMSQRAGVLSSMSRANGYAVIPGHTGPWLAGSKVRVLLQDDAELS